MRIRPRQNSYRADADPAAGTCSATRAARLLLLPALLALAGLPSSARAQGGATEAVTQAATIGTVRCGTDEYRLALVRASLPADRVAAGDTWVDAVGYALAPTSGTGQVKLFAHYWFNSASRNGQGQYQEKRDDTRGTLASGLLDYNQVNAPGNVADFFKGCDSASSELPSFAAHVPAFGTVLQEASPSMKLEEVLADLRNNAVGLSGEMKLSEDRRSLGKPLTIDPNGQLAFGNLVRASLANIFGLAGPPPANLSSQELKDALQKTQADPAAALRERDRAVEEMKRAERDRDAALADKNKAEHDRDEALAAAKLSRFLSVFMWAAGIVLLLLVTGLIRVLTRRSLRERFFSSRAAIQARARWEADNQLYICLRKLGGRSEAQQEFDKLLDDFPVNYEEAKGAQHAGELYNQLRGRVTRFTSMLAAPQPIVAGGEGARAAQNFIAQESGLDQQYASDLTAGFKELRRQINENLLPAVGPGPTLLSRVEEVRGLAERMWGKLAPEKDCPEEGALKKVADEWEGLLDALEPLRRFNQQLRDQTRLPEYVLEATNLFEDLRRRFILAVENPGEVRNYISEFFRELEKVYQDTLLEHSQSGVSPEYMLNEIKRELGVNKEKADKLRKTNAALLNLKDELPAEADAKGDVSPASTPHECSRWVNIIERAKEVARAHRESLEVLRKYDGDGGLVEAANSIADKVNAASATIDQVLPGAPEMIDAKVSALVAAYGGNTRAAAASKAYQRRSEKRRRLLIQWKTRARESTRLASALSGFVNLSEDETLGAEQVRAVREQFEAGEATHRLLRLRLSAALLSLRDAVGRVNAEGRDDALIALKTDEVEKILHDLLSDLESHRGDALWAQRLKSGFAEHWLHTLFRAELLAETYYFDSEVLSPLVDPLRQAGEALRATLSKFGVVLQRVVLLSEPPRSAAVESRIDPSLRGVEEVRQKVRMAFDRGNSFIVDVVSFPYQGGGDEYSSGIVKDASLAEWDGPRDGRAVG
jgi:hypothetical protein